VWKKGKGTELSVFKGREAKLNRAIFQILATKGQLTIYDMLKEIKKSKGLKHTHYGNVNKRVRTLLQTGYLKIVDIRIAKAGSEKAIYELTTRTYLALMFASVDLNKILNRINDETAIDILTTLAVAYYAPL
jgi:hypothetical protein